MLPDPEDIQGLNLPLAEGGDNPLPDAAGGESGLGESATTPPFVPKKVGASTPPQQPFLLSKGLAPVPPKLVTKIQNLEFVDMAELLRDNLEVQRQVASQDRWASTTGQSTRNRRREILDLLSWVSCFGMAVLTGKHPQMIKPLLAYQTMIVREARRCRGNGWLAYDTYFRQQVAGDPEADWSCLNTSLYEVTFLAQGGKGGQSCTTHEMHGDWPGTRSIYDSGAAHVISRTHRSLAHGHAYGVLTLYGCKGHKYRRGA